MRLLISTLSLFPLIASADLVITEVMSNSLHSSSNINGDWWEMTNNGNSAVNIANYSWDDESNLSNQQIFPSYTVQPGESVIILDEATTTAIVPFQNAWGIPGTVRVFVRSDFSNFPGFSSGGDTIYLYDNNGVTLDSFAFGGATSGSSFANFSDGTPVPGGISINGLFGAGSSNQNPADIGSPGSAAEIPPPVPPQFLPPFDTSWPVDRNLNTSEFRVTAADANDGDLVTLSVIAKPDWLTINNLGGGVAQLSGTPTTNEAGTHTFTLQAMDDSGASDPVTQTYTINILPNPSPIILNEYNAVGPDQFLDGGDEDTPGAPGDTRFGRLEGNGGEWLEFVVTGDGSSPTIDLRGWSIEILNDQETRTLKLSNSIALSEIPVGTILTFSEFWPTSFNSDSRLATEGYTWTNIWMFDANLVDQSASHHPATPAIGANNTRIIVYGSSDELIDGPSGESIAAEDTNSNIIPDSLIALNDTEVFKLEQNPLNTVDPLFGIYQDGTTSTFGAPNSWNGGASSQSFASFISTNSPPAFDNVLGLYAVRGEYSAEIRTTDPQAHEVAITAITLPSFLSLVDVGNGAATIQNNRPLTANDVGTYDILFCADDGQAIANKSYYSYRLTVADPAPSVILNEYNAVSGSNFLNGGTAEQDDDGNTPASDSHFGRIMGNGGDWFELAVIGHGESGAIDLRGWTIEVGRADDPSNLFVLETTITLTQDPSWSIVRNGTILTFTGLNTANGGLNTDLNREDRFATEGWGWSNIYLGDNSLVSGAHLLDIDIDGNGMLFRIRDASGSLIFGPVGEGLSTNGFPSGMGVSSEDIFELEGDPTPSVGITDSANDTGLDGYDDSSNSTFGAPNSFTPLDAGDPRPQDFTPYIFQATTYAAWAAGFGIGSEFQTDNNDGDSWNNLEEYLFGGDPTQGSSIPSVVIDAESGAILYNVRTNDPNFRYLGQRGNNLLNWTDQDLTFALEPSPLGGDFGRFIIIYDGDEPTQFFRVIPQ